MLVAAIDFADAVGWRIHAGTIEGPLQLYAYFNFIGTRNSLEPECRLLLPGATVNGTKY